MEPLSALFKMIVSWMISIFRACLGLYVVLCLGFSGICNVLACFCRWLVFYCVEFCVYLFGVCQGWA